MEWRFSGSNSAYGAHYLPDKGWLGPHRQEEWAYYCHHYGFSAGLSLLHCPNFPINIQSHKYICNSFQVHCSFLASPPRHPPNGLIRVFAGGGCKSAFLIHSPSLRSASTLGALPNPDLSNLSCLCIVLPLNFICYVAGNVMRWLQNHTEKF